MKVLLSGRYTQRGGYRDYEKAFSQQSSVTYCGLPYKFERPGYAPDLDVAELASRDTWDLFFYIEDWQQAFPRGIEKLPFPTACYLPDACFDIPRYRSLAPFFDYVFLPTSWLLDLFRHFNPNTYYLPLACDPDRLKEVEVGEKIYDLGFVGSLYPDRKGILRSLATTFKVNPEFFAGFDGLTVKRATWVYCHSKIVFNKSAVEFSDYNPRVFEALACRSLLLTNVFEKGDPGLLEDRKHLVFYRSLDEIVDLAKYYLAHDDEREAIAEQGRQLALAKHTYAHRIESIFQTIANNQHRMQAPVRKANVNKVFLSYQRAYSGLMMLDCMANLFAEAEASFFTRIMALWCVAVAVLRRLRRMAWRKLARAFANAIRGRAARR